MRASNNRQPVLVQAYGNHLQIARIEGKQEPKLDNHGACLHRRLRAEGLEPKPNQGVAMLACFMRFYSQRDVSIGHGSSQISVLFVLIRLAFNSYLMYDSKTMASRIDLTSRAPLFSMFFLETNMISHQRPGQHCYPVTRPKIYNRTFGFAPFSRDPSPSTQAALLALTLVFAITLALHAAFDASNRPSIYVPPTTGLSQ